MGLYTIKHGDTLSGIADRYKPFGIKTWQEIWDHAYNKIIKLYWPKGIDTTTRELPIGYSLYVPTRNGVRSANVTKDKPLQTFVLGRGLKDLRLKINFYDNYDQYAWLSHDEWERQNLNKKWEADYRKKHSVEWRYGNLSLPLSETRDAHSDALTYVDPRDNTVVQTNDRPQDFSFTDSGTMPVPGDLNFAGFQGDNTRVRPMENGYVYIFAREPQQNPCTLFAAFRVFGGNYQRVKVTKDDDTHTGKVGDGSTAQAYLEIKDFFPQGRNQVDPEHYKEYFVYTSRIPLTWNSLCEGPNSLAHRMDILGSPLPQAHWFYTDKNKPFKPLSGSEIHEEFNSSKGRCALPDRLTYHAHFNRQRKYIDFNLADAECEGLRRNKIYQKYFGAYLVWKDSDARSEKSFLYHILTYLHQKGMIGESDLNRDPGSPLEQFLSNDVREYERSIEEFHFAATDLTTFLSSEAFKQVITNYFSRIQSELQQQSGAVREDLFEKLMDLLAGTHLNLCYSRAGASYLDDVLETRDSFFNKIYGAKEWDIPDDFLADTSFIGNGVFLGRKVVEGFYTTLEEFIPKIFAKIKKNKNKDEVVKAVNAFMKTDLGNGLKFKIPELNQFSKSRSKNVKHKTIVRLLNSVEQSKNFEILVKNAKVGFSFCETINAALLTMEAFDSDKQMKLNDWLILVGSYADMTANLAGPHADLFNSMVRRKFPTIAEKILRGGSVGFRGIARVVPFFSLVSASVDAYLYYQSAREAFKYEDYDIALGNGMVVLGNVIIAGGTTAFIASKFTALGIGAGAASLGLTWTGIGLIIVLIGAALVYFNDTDIQDLAQACLFGSRPNLSKTISRQIQELLNLLVKFKIHHCYLINKNYGKFDGEYLSLCEITLGDFRTLTNTSVIKLRGVTIIGKDRWLERFSSHEQSNKQFTITLPEISLKLSDFIDKSGNSLTWQDNMFTGGQEKYPQFSAGQTLELKSGHQLKIKLLLSEKDDETGTFSIVRVKLFFKNDVDEIKGKIGLNIMDSRIQKGQTYYMREKYKELDHFEEFHVFASS